MKFEFSKRSETVKPSAIREIFKFTADPSVISFAAGNPAAELFPVNALAKLSEELFQTDAAAALQYSVTEGYMPLREKLKTRLSEKFQIGEDFDDLIIVTGGQQGIDLTAKIFCNEGDVVICENPSFIGALNAFRSYNSNLVGIDVDSDGINIDLLEEALKTQKNVKLIYTIPNFQNPSGLCMSLEKRKQLYQLAERYGVVILEDNPYGELRFSGVDIPSIKSFDKAGIVIYCSSFSKILSAGMRIGYVSAHNDIIQKLVVAKQTNDVHTNIFFQMVVDHYMEQYDMDKHILGLRDAYGKKCDAMVNAIIKNFDKRVTFIKPEGGFFIWCNMTYVDDIMPFCRLAVQNKVAIVPGATFSPDESKASTCFRMNFSMPSFENIEKGIAILGKLQKEYQTK